MSNDAQVLFDGMDKMLIETANAEWHDVLGSTTKRDWETFKKTVATYITTKILPDDAYDIQVTYLQERMKPKKLDVKQWYLRMQTLNRYLPYFIPSIDKVKEINPSATFKEWWKDGMLSETNIKKTIKNKAPDSWQRQLKLNTIGPAQITKLTTNDLVGYYETLETLERRQREPSKPGPRGRGTIRKYQGQKSHYQEPVGSRYQQQQPRGNGRFTDRGSDRQGPQRQTFRGSGNEYQSRGSDSTVKQRGSALNNNRFSSAIGQQQKSPDKTFFSEEAINNENKEDKNNTLQQEEEQYAAWTDHFNNDHETSGEEQEEYPMGNKSEAEEADEHSEDSSAGDQEEENEAPTTVITIAIPVKGKEDPELFNVLLDTGTNRNMGTKEAVSRFKGIIKAGKRRSWMTAAGKFTTTATTKIPRHSILELNSRRILGKLRIEVSPNTLGNYDFIFGRRYLSYYGFHLNFASSKIEWDGMETEMKPYNDIGNEEHAQEILDNTYGQVDFKALAEQQKHLALHQQNMLKELWSEYDDLFQGNLGEWPDEEVEIELLPNSSPYHCIRPIRIPRVHYETIRKEVNRLVSIKVLKEVSVEEAGPWCSPSFIVPKKDKKVRFVTDYREVNKRIRRKPWPMPHIADMIQDIGPYTYVTALDLSMGFYHFRLNEAASKLSTFMLPWGLYRYLRLPMGLCVSPDIFQANMARLFADMPNVRVYIDDILIFTNGSYEDHLHQVRRALTKLQSKNMAVNVEKSYWAVKEVDYLGFRLTPNGILPQARKVKAIRDLDRPTNKRQLRKFIGMVNYYRYMWKGRSDILAPLAELAGKNSIFRWTEKQQQAFDKMKAMVGKEVMLSFPNYNERFQLYTDASDLQLGAVLMQGKKTLAFFSKKLNKAQRNYSVGEKEMLSIVEALKEFRTMIYGYPIDIHTDHKNWTHDKTFRNARVMNWRMFLEDYAPSLHYVKGESNEIADALSRLPFTTSIEDSSYYSVIEDCFDIAPWQRQRQLITFETINKEQLKDPYVRRLQEYAPDRLGMLFEDIGRQTGPDNVFTETDIIDGKTRIIIPSSLRHRLCDWYHETLLHPGVNRMYDTMRQHFTWPKMRETIAELIKKCDACQRAKRGNKGYGLIPLKDVETEPWKDIAIDLSGPWKATIDKKIVIFHTLTIIDVFTGWVEILPIDTKKKEHIRDLFEREWLRRYPRPSRVLYDLGGEFDNYVFRTKLVQWFIKPTPITNKNPRANAIVERMHLVLGDMLRIQLAKQHEHDRPIDDMTSAAAYAIRATVHGTTKYSPAQLVYQKDLILRTRVEAETELVRQRRQAAIIKNNQRENKRRIPYKYKIGDYVLILSRHLDPKMQLHQGPYQVLAYDSNSGTLHIQRRNYVEPINIRNVRPYFGKTSKT
ncbi:reverse transcriptase RNA-dependent DNA polymerase [Nitzschia inconspicua]|nr:reverse transcriptase RNA-dependent DNA polymerase [Nitzschia inconspicua]